MVPASSHNHPGPGACESPGQELGFPVSSCSCEAARPPGQGLALLRFQPLQGVGAPGFRPGQAWGWKREQGPVQLELRAVAVAARPG